MRTPFVRPFFAKFFYWYAGASTVLGVLASVFYPMELQAIRYAAMVSSLTLERVIEA